MQTFENYQDEKVLHKIINSNNKKKWYNTLNRVQIYINENKKRPSRYDKNPEIKALGQWISNQQIHYKYKKFIMRITNIRNFWEKFIKENNNYFKSNIDKWYNILNKVKTYINENKKRPSPSNKDPEIKFLGEWILKQQYRYPIEEKIMKLSEIRNAWKEFLEEYHEYFKSNIEKWYDTLDKVKIYINENKKRPSTKSKDPKIKALGKWIQHQQYNYPNQKNIMCYLEIRNAWEKFKDEIQKSIL